MTTVKIHILNTGKVKVSPFLPYGGNCGIIKASGLIVPRKRWLWLPVLSFLIEHPSGLILVDTGWHRDVCPNGVYDRHAQLKYLGNWLLCHFHQANVRKKAAVSEQLAALGIQPSDLDYVILTHLDGDQANGLRAVRDAKQILVSKEEMKSTSSPRIINRIRYQKKWWDGISMTGLEWNGNQGPSGKSFDLFGDGSLLIINIPGHSDGQVAVKISNGDGKFVLLCADGAYSDRSWNEMLCSGIASNHYLQLQSLAWIAAMNRDPNCVKCIASHHLNLDTQTIDL